MRYHIALIKMGIFSYFNSSEIKMHFTIGSVP